MRIHVIDKIEAKLRKYPELLYKIEDNMVLVDPPGPSGFSVCFVVREDGFTVGYDGWHEEFGDEEEAMECFAFGFSDQCRLKVVKRGKMECSWAVEAWNGRDWIEESVTGAIFVPFWRSKVVEYRQNSFIKGPL